MSEIIILERIKNYLGSGGPFNPELMEHEKVRDLIMDCREEIQKRDELLRCAEWVIINADHRDYPEQWLKQYEELKV